MFGICDCFNLIKFFDINVQKLVLMDDLRFIKQPGRLSITPNFHTPAASACILSSDGRFKDFFCLGVSFGVTLTKIPILWFRTFACEYLKTSFPDGAGKLRRFDAHFRSLKYLLPLRYFLSMLKTLVLSKFDNSC